MKIKKTISLEDTVIRKAEEKSKRLSFNFSAYITYLINKDCGEIKGIEEASTLEVNKFSTEVSKGIDNILNFDDVEIG